jgi:ParB-like chromosome segregation protein Spo0J
MSEDGRTVAFACERDTVKIALSQIVPLRVMRAGTKESSKYNQILASVRIVGLVEPPVVIADPDCPGRYFL